MGDRVEQDEEAKIQRNTPTPCRPILCRAIQPVRTVSILILTLIRIVTTQVLINMHILHHCSYHPTSLLLEHYCSYHATALITTALIILLLYCATEIILKSPGGPREAPCTEQAGGT